jgi:hypothetical protein
MEIAGIVLLLVVVLGAAVAPLIRKARKAGVDRWGVAYLRSSLRRRAPGPEEEIHLLLCIADHYEPKWAGATPEIAAERVARWIHDYPRLFGRFRDSDGRPPRHTFFYPFDEYEPAYLDALAELCRAGFGEVEIHLHHDNDSADGLRDKLLEFKTILAERHGLLARSRITGAIGYAFIHGNWALCNSRPDGRFCGVNNELEVLRATGCYADLTYPSAPSRTQPAKINSIYYASDRLGRPRSQDWGWNVGSITPPAQALLLIQGPLLLNWRKRGLLPGLENGCLQGSQPPDGARVDNWLRARIQVPFRPDWFFVKLHAHGTQEDTQAVLLAEPMVRFHDELARRAAANPRFHYHYVTARELYNLVKAAESGWQGTVAAARDHELTWIGDEREAINRQPDSSCRALCLQGPTQSFQE